MDLSGNTIEIEPGVHLHYIERGAGRPLVFIPSCSFTTEMFKAQIAHFSQYYRVIAYDPRSHGKSTITAVGNDYDTHGRDLAALIHLLGLKDVVLAGWSFGCLTIWNYIRQFGTESLRGLVFMSQSPRTLAAVPTDTPAGALDEVGAKYREQMLANGDPRQFIQQYIMQSLVQRPLTEAEIAWVMGESNKTPLEIIASLFASGMLSNFRGEAEHAHAALPIMNFIPEHQAENSLPFFNANFPAGRTFTLGGGMMFWEHAEVFNREMDGFLNTL